MADIQKMYGTFEAPVLEGERATLSGRAPASEMIDYPAQVQSYTGGRGRLALRLEGYFPCHDQEEVIEALDYDCEGDLDNPSGSIFCSHGAGFFVPWNEVPDHMHIREKMPTADSLTDDAGANVSLNKRNTSGADTFSEGNNGLPAGKNDAKSSGASYASSYIEDKELEEIFLREFGSKKQQEDRYRGVPGKESSVPKRKAPGRRENDGSGNFSRTKGNDYIRSPKRIQSRNFEIIQATPECCLAATRKNSICWWTATISSLPGIFLKELAETSLEAARGKLMDILCNYQGFIGDTLIVVFDAYRVKGNPGEIFKYHNIHVVYTKEAETARPVY